jgi:hypothetical protein
MKQDLDYNFPIQTKTACTSKWGWSTIWLNTGTTSSCHRCDDFDIPHDNFASFHNVPQKIKNRQDMLQGIWPGDGCEYCRNIEQAAGFSDRMHVNDIPGMAPVELKDNPTEVYVTPTTLEIFAENTCNFKCVYCNPVLSSRIEQETKQFDPTFQNNNLLSNTQRKKLFNDFFDWLEENVHKLVRLHLLGGETFIQHELMNRTLDLLERKPSEGLQLCIFSNFNPPDKYFKAYIDKIRYLWQQGNIARFDLTASIDCWGPQAEYVRNGLDCEKFEENFAWAAEQPEDFLWLNVNQTVSSFTMKTMPDLITMFNKYNTHRHIGHYAMLVDGFDFMRPEVFAYETWEQTWSKIYSSMRSETIENQEAIKIMIGLQSVMRKTTEHNYEQIKELHKYFDEIDRRRNTHWRDLWPELVI